MEDIRNEYGQTLVYNSATCSGCGSVTGHCTCHKGTLNMNEVHDESKNAARLSLLCDDDTSTRHALEAVKASKAGFPDEAADLHVKAARAHDRAAANSDGEVARRHALASKLHRRVSAMHKLASADSTDAYDTTALAPSEPNLNELQRRLTVNSYATNAYNDDNTLPLPPGLFDFAQQEATGLTRNQSLLYDGPSAVYVGDDFLPMPSTADLLNNAAYDAFSPKAQGSNADLWQGRTRTAARDSGGRRPDQTDDAYNYLPRRISAADMEDEEMAEDELTRENRRRMGTDDDILETPNIMEAVLEARKQEVELERAGQGRWGKAV